MARGWAGGEPGVGVRTLGLGFCAHGPQPAVPAALAGSQGPTQRTSRMNIPPLILRNARRRCNNLCFRRQRRAHGASWASCGARAPEATSTVSCARGRMCAAGAWPTWPYHAVAPKFGRPSSAVLPLKGGGTFRLLKDEFGLQIIKTVTLYKSWPQSGESGCRWEGRVFAMFCVLDVAYT